MSRIPQDQIIEDDAITSFAEEQVTEWATHLSPEQVPLAIAYEWNRLQQVLSSVENRIDANRGLIESIASQQ